LENGKTGPDPFTKSEIGAIFYVKGISKYNNIMTFAQNIPRE
jgi:hypothetical protein